MLIRPADTGVANILYALGRENIQRAPIKTLSISRYTRNNIPELCYKYSYVKMNEISIYIKEDLWVFI